MELWRKGTAGTTGVCLYQDPMVNLNSTADKTEGVSDNATKIYFVDGYDPYKDDL